jgi:hypothetical protein
VVANMLLKFSIGLFLLQVARNRVHIWIIRGVFILSVLYSIAFLIAILLQCHPVSAYWEMEPKDGHYCVSISVFMGLNYGFAAFNVGQPAVGDSERIADGDCALRCWLTGQSASYLTSSSGSSTSRRVSGDLSSVYLP